MSFHVQEWQLHPAFKSPLAELVTFTTGCRLGLSCQCACAKHEGLAVPSNGWEWLPSSTPGPSSLLPSQCLGEGKNEWQYFLCVTARPASNLTTSYVSTHFEVTVGAQLVASKVLLKGLDWTEFGL